MNIDDHQSDHLDGNGQVSQRYTNQPEDWFDKLPLLDPEIDFNAMNACGDDESMELDKYFQIGSPTTTGNFADEPTLAALNFTEERFDSNDLNEYLRAPEKDSLINLNNSSCVTTSYLPYSHSNSSPSIDSLSVNVLSSTRPSCTNASCTLSDPISNSFQSQNGTHQCSNFKQNDISQSLPSSVHWKPDETGDSIQQCLSYRQSSRTGEACIEQESPCESITGASSNQESSFSSQLDDSDGNREEEDDEENDSSGDESFYKDYEAKDLLGASTSEGTENTHKWSLDVAKGRKQPGQQRYFWQYNVQSKGPKGTRIVCETSDSNNDPHVLVEAKDPVFNPDYQINFGHRELEGVKHAGKARRGDGNDLTPCPRRLLMIGLELKKLNRIINDLTPVSQVSPTSRNRSKKEKNKLASRVCRLKKKAQHEANKIKFYGLQCEHKELMSVLDGVKNLAIDSLKHREMNRQTPLLEIFEQIVKMRQGSTRVAGNTAKFVNSILDNVASGQSDGGLSVS
ncbi:uncharacterized protein LOC141850767 isoform X2 [Brevipalpus obovatus]|uniref:uncharacterized protein LOC141850767 isoform X2 n=1 Tax=Brevipalpus obovatus TaxID=246614 RepID=UPI003D9F3DE9